MHWKLCLIFTLVLTGCTPKNQRTPPDTLVVAIGSEPVNLDPRFATDAYSVRISALLFNSLVRLGPDLEAAPEAADSWTYKDHVYTFHLRPELKFHNGRPVEREDVEFSFAQYLGTSSYASNLDLIKNVEVQGETGNLTVKVTVLHNTDKILKTSMPIIKILPKAEILKAGRDFNKLLIGTGGFKYAGRNLNEIRLDAVNAKVKHLVFKIVRDDFTRYQKMLKGEVDVAQVEISADKIPNFEKRPDDFNVYIYPGLSINYLVVNHKDALLKNKGVRQALAQCLNRGEIIQYKMRGLAKEATSILTPTNYYFDPDLRNPPLDPEAAHASIAKLNLLGSKLVLKTSNEPGVIEEGRVLLSQLERTGLDIKIESYEWGTFYDDVKKGKFQIAMMKWLGTLDPDLYRMMFHSKEFPPGRNRGYYSNPELDGLLEKAAAEEDLDQRKKLYTRIQEIVQQDVAFIPLWYQQQTAITRKNVINYKPTITGDFWPFFEASKQD